MRAGIVVFLLAVLFIAGGLLAFWRAGRRELPPNLPPPLPDEPEEDWGSRPPGSSPPPPAPRPSDRTGP